MKLLSLTLIIQHLLAKDNTITHLDNLADVQLFSGIQEKPNEYDTYELQQSRTFGTIRKQLTSRIFYHFDEIAEKRGVTTSKATRDIILRHGCYCFPNDRGSVGPRNDYHGPPIDELDALCYKLHRAQNCMKKELLEDSDYNILLENNCDINKKYLFHKKNGGGFRCGPKRNNKEWIENPENACEYRNCLLEKEFIDQTITLFESGYTKPEGSFTHTDEIYNSWCVNPKSNRESSNIQTFAQENRSPDWVNDPTLPKDENGNNIFVSMKGIRAEMNQCCGSGIERRPYNDAISECCIDGAVRSFGTCL